MMMMMIMTVRLFWGVVVDMTSTLGSGTTRVCSSLRSSSGEGRPVCWVGRLPGRWSLPAAVCSAPRRCGWPVGGGAG